MVIIHIFCVTDELFSGVGTVAPKHVLYQQLLNEEVGYVNLSNKNINYLKNRFLYSKGFRFSKLPSPFCHPDIVVFHELYYLPYLKMYKELNKNKTPYIIFPHGGLAKSAQSIKKIKKAVANFVWFNRFFKSALSIQYLTTKEKSESVLCVDSFVCPNGMDSHNGSIVKKSEVVRFVYIGRFSIFHKGLDVLIDSIEDFEKNNTNEKCVFELYGPKNKDWLVINKIIKSKGLKTIKLHESVKGKEKEKILRECDFFIQTSRFEGLPTGVLEALGYGKPVVVSNGVNLTDVIEKYKCGYCSDLSKIDISKNITNAIKMSDVEYAHMAQSARKLIDDNYSWETVSKKEVNDYKTKLKERREKNEC